MHNAAAAVLNPGALQGIEQFSANLLAEPVFGWQNAPFPGPAGRAQVDAEPAFAPFFFAGAGVRVHERVVVALAVSPTQGFSSQYSNVPQLGGADLGVTVSSLEATAAVSVRLLDKLSLGAGYRATYSAMKLQQPAIDPGTGTVMENEVDLSGWNALGARVGLHYAPTSNVELGLTYTSKISTTLDGQAKTTIPGAPLLKFDAEQELSAPHALRAGGSVSLLDRKLLLAVDLKTLLYADSNNTVVTVIKTPAGDQRQSTKQDWKNVYAGSFGAEYRALDALALRVGYSLTNSATPRSTASPVGIGPGLVHGIHAGLGVRAMPSLDVDLGAFYVMASSKIADSQPNGGQYELSMVVGALSATYHR